MIVEIEVDSLVEGEAFVVTDRCKQSLRGR